MINIKTLKIRNTNNSIYTLPSLQTVHTSKDVGPVGRKLWLKLFQDMWRRMDDDVSDQVKHPMYQHQWKSI